jgi:hypothetical protein
VLLDYGRPPSLIERLRAHIRPSYFAVVVAIGEFQLARTFGGDRAPPSLAALVGGFCAVLWIGFARVRWADAVGRSFSASSDQLLIAAVLCLMGVLECLNRARTGQGPYGWDWWFTYNPGYRFGPLWALRPLMLSAAGIAWYCTVLAVALRRERAARWGEMKVPGKQTNPPPQKPIEASVG